MTDPSHSIGHISLFKNLSSPQIFKLISLFEEVEFEPRETIIKEGDIGDSLYIVSSGSVMVTKAVDADRQEILTELDAGEFFGEMSFIDSAPRSATVTALERTELLKIAVSDIKDYMKDDPEAAAILFQNFAIVISERLRRTSDKIGELARESVQVKKTVDDMTTEIISVVSHELRTPVAVIRGATEVLECAELTPGKKEDFMYSIKKHTERLSTMLDDITQLADVQFRGVQIEKIFGDMKWLIEDVIEEIKGRAKEKNISIEVNISDSLPKVPMHKGKMRRVIYHLIDNAIKFNCEGGRVLISSEIDTEPVPNQIIISVSDEGQGIPEERREQLFKCFRQEKKTLDTDRSPGMGLGLPLARSLIFAHGGRLRVEPREPKGSTFSFTLPVQ